VVNSFCKGVRKPRVVDKKNEPVSSPRVLTLIHVEAIWNIQEYPAGYVFLYRRARSAILSREISVGVQSRLAIVLANPSHVR